MTQGGLVVSLSETSIGVVFVPGLDRLPREQPSSRDLMRPAVRLALLGGFQLGVSSGRSSANQRLLVIVLWTGVWQDKGPLYDCLAFVYWCSVCVRCNSVL